MYSILSYSFNVPYTPDKITLLSFYEVHPNQFFLEIQKRLDIRVTLSFLALCGCTDLRTVKPSIYIY